MKLVSCIAVVTVAAITASGCGPRAPVIEKHYVNPVEGQVIWKGKPLGNAKVTFNPNGWKLHAFTTLPVGFTEPDGTYRLDTYKHGDGAPQASTSSR